MTTRLGAVLALLAQTIPLAGPGAFFVCVHEDGQVQYELAAKPCCEDAGSAASAADSERTDAGLAGVAPGCDHCRDYPATFFQVRSSDGDTKIAPAYDEVFSPALPVSAHLPSIAQFHHRGPVNSVGPPGGMTVLSLLKTVVLQV